MYCLDRDRPRLQTNESDIFCIIRETDLHRIDVARVVRHRCPCVPRSTLSARRSVSLSFALCASYPRVLIATYDHTLLVLPKEENVLVGLDTLREPLLRGEVEPDIRRRGVDDPVHGIFLTRRSVAQQMYERSSNFQKHDLENNPFLQYAIEGARRCQANVSIVLQTTKEQSDTNKCGSFTIDHPSCTYLYINMYF